MPVGGSAHGLLGKPTGINLAIKEGYLGNLQMCRNLAPLYNHSEFSCDSVRNPE